MEILQASSVQVTSSMSILKSANQQPKLALDVLQGSMPSGPAKAQSVAQQPANPVQPVSAGASSDSDADDRGGSIDIRV